MSYTFEGGIHPYYGKELSNKGDLKTAPLVSTYYIPLAQHIGKPAKPLVKRGDEVKVGQLIAQADGFVSANIHSPVDGKVTQITKHYHPVLGKVDTIVIQRDPNYDGKIRTRNRNWRTLNRKEILASITDAGIVGMGGATFPTHVKLSPPPDKKIDTVILNGAECEPYLTADDILMKTKAEEIVEGAKIIAYLLEAERIFIGVEDNKPAAIEALREASAGNPKIQVAVLETKYPQGGEKQLIYAITGRVVPEGGLPADVGVVVQNVGTAYAIYEAVVKVKPLIERVVTVTGDVKEPQNFLVRIGTPFEDMIEFAGGFVGEPVKVISGGPMMGFAQRSLQVPVLKGTSGILVMNKERAIMNEIEPCIWCGRCVDVCPMNLVPCKMTKMVEYERFSEAQSDFHIMNCIECGSCSYVCPASRPLVQLIRIGKMALRKQGGK